MAISSKLTLASALLTAQVITVSAQPGADPVEPVVAAEVELQPPSYVEVAPVVVIPTRVRPKPSPLATTRTVGRRAPAGRRPDVINRLTAAAIPRALLS